MINNNMNNVITKSLVKAGYEQNIVKIVDACGGIMCEIGEYSFFFAGIEGEETTANEYKKNVSVNDIINEIYDTLEAFGGDEDFREEYDYYYFYLIENVSQKTTVYVVSEVIEREISKPIIFQTWEDALEYFYNTLLSALGENYDVESTEELHDCMIKDGCLTIHDNQTHAQAYGETSNHDNYDISVDKVEF